MVICSLGIETYERLAVSNGRTQALIISLITAVSPKTKASNETVLLKQYSVSCTTDHWSQAEVYKGKLWPSEDIIK